MLREAGVAILVCGDPTLEKHADTGCRTALLPQNLLLAYMQKVGAVWLGIYPREERVSGLRKLLAMPDYVIPFSLVPIGYPAESKPPRPDRYNTMKIHHNHGKDFTLHEKAKELLFRREIRHGKAEISPCSRKSASLCKRYFC